jgi:hypothetical protein
MISNYEEQAHAYKYLANYHLKNNQLEDAFTAAQKCTEFPEVLAYVPFFALLRPALVLDVHCLVMTIKQSLQEAFIDTYPHEPEYVNLGKLEAKSWIRLVYVYLTIHVY